MSAVAPAASSGGPSTGRPCDYVMALRILGGCSGLAIMILGLVVLITSSFNLRLMITCIYRIIFGILIILAELRVTSLLRPFAFLTHFIGIGLFYIFVGGLALDSEWYCYVIAIVMLVCGVLYMFLPCCCQRESIHDKAVDGAPAATRMNDMPSKTQSQSSV